MAIITRPDPIFTDPALTWASAYLTEGSVPRALKPSHVRGRAQAGAAALLAAGRPHTVLPLSGATHQGSLTPNLWEYELNFLRTALA